MILLVSLHSSTALHAQNHSVWERGKSAVGKTQQKPGQMVFGLRKWKAHLEQWGMDTSYSRTVSIGGRLSSDGWSGAITYGRKNTKGTLAHYQLSFSEVKHDKEIKLQISSRQFPELGAGTSYIYGKRNNLYLLQLTYSREMQLFPALLDGNIAIGLRYGGGLTLAMLKPYYLKLIYPDYAANHVTARLQEESYNDTNTERFLNPSLILGRAAWSKGLDEMQYVPGIHADCAIVIAPAAKRAFTQTITLGGQVMVTKEALPVLINNDAYRYRMCLFAGLELGKRWSR